MAELKKLKPKELVEMEPQPEQRAEICRRLERLEILEPLYAASESLRQQMNEQAAKDLTVFNQVRERLEKREAARLDQRARIVECLKGNVFSESQWVKGYCAGIVAALTAFDDVARAALEGDASCHEPYKSGIKTTCHKCGAYPVEQARAAVEGK